MNIGPSSEIEITSFKEDQPGLIKLMGGKTAAFIGVCGVVGFILLFGVFIYFGFFQRGGVYDNLRVKLGISTITSLVSEIELYKIQNGKYPETLEAFHKSLPENSIVFVFDPTHVAMDGERRHYHYELIDDSHYYLLGVGADEKPFTNDDVLPNIELKKNGGIGLLIHEGVVACSETLATPTSELLSLNLAAAIR